MTPTPEIRLFFAVLAFVGAILCYRQAFHGILSSAHWKQSTLFFFLGGANLSSTLLLSLQLLLDMPIPSRLVFFLGLLGAGLGSVLYFIPSIVASQRSHLNVLALFLLNALLGWSIFGWAGALVWATIKTDTRAGASPDTHAGASRDGRTNVVPDDGRKACVQCGNRVSVVSIASDGRCQRCYKPFWAS